MDYRHPHLILGVDYGVSADEATLAFSKKAKRARRDPEAPFTLEDLTWALNQLEHGDEDAADAFDHLRVPADPDAYHDAQSIPPPVPRLGRLSGTDRSAGTLLRETHQRHELLSAAAAARARPTLFDGPPSAKHLPMLPPPAEKRRASRTGLAIAAVAVAATVYAFNAPDDAGDPGPPPEEAAEVEPPEPAEPTNEGQAIESIPEQPTVTDSGQWQRIEHDEAVLGGEETQAMRSVTVGGPGLVAVGSDEDREAAAVWTSTDGLTWQRVPHDEDVFGGNVLMWSVTVGGPGLVAVGSDEDREAAAVWTSTDGLTWQRVPHEEDVLGGDGRQSMSALTVGGPGLVAAGYDDGRSAAALWTSSDGLNWQRVPHDEDVFGGEGSQGIRSITVGGGGLVAAGDDSGRNAAAVWTSTDGLTWQRVAHDEDVFGGDADAWPTMSSVVAGGPGLIAVGYDEQSAVVWTSEDGLAWQRVPHDEDVFGGDGGQYMLSIADGGSGPVAVGHDEIQRAVVWTSEDGLDWQRLPHDEDVFGGEGWSTILSVTAGGPGLVAVGMDFGRDAAAVWTGPSESGDEGETELPDEVSEPVTLETIRPEELAVRDLECFGFRDAPLWRGANGEFDGPHAWEFWEDVTNPHPSARFLGHFLRYHYLTDLTGDGQAELVVSASCTTGAGGSPFEVAVFTIGADGPEFLDLLHSGISGAVYGDLLRDITVESGRILALHGVYGQDFAPETVRAVPVAFSWDEDSRSFLVEQREEPRAVDLASFRDVRLAPGWPGSPANSVRDAVVLPASDLTDAVEQYVRYLDVGDYWAAHDMLAPELTVRPGWTRESYVDFWIDLLVGAAIIDVIEVDSAAQSVTAEVDFFVVSNEASRELIRFDFRRTTEGRALISDYLVIRSDWRNVGR